MKVTETGTAIYRILTSDAALRGMVVDRIYPLMAKNSTVFPFIAYRRSGLETGSTKDLLYQHRVTVDIAIAGSDYKQGVEIAQRVIDMLDNKEFAQYDINSVLLNDSSEDYVDDAFVQMLVFTLTINK
jgi:hypothetical protein